MADDYWSGFVHGQATNSNSSSAGGSAAGGLLILVAALAAAVAAAGIFAFIALYPLATVAVLLGVFLLTVIFSAGIGVIWHDPSPIFLFDQHWLYFNWVGLVAAGLAGLGIAYLAVTRIEFRLHERIIYFGLRHLWRVLLPSVTLAVVLMDTQADTGITKWGLWLLPIGLATALHFALWSDKISLRREWLEQQDNV